MTQLSTNILSALLLNIIIIGIILGFVIYGFVLFVKLAHRGIKALDIYIEKNNKHKIDEN